jgi:hypothetical protein
MREVDPIGASGLHEAAADVLLPLLSGRTREAEDYLWVLVGLNWAGQNGRTDSDIWSSFSRFEKALKLYWYTNGNRRQFDGIKAIKVAAESGDKDLDFVLLSNQRSQGILGAYARSLRRARLIENRSLQVTDGARGLIFPLRFGWGGELTHGWRRHFDRVDQSVACDRTGNMLLTDLGRKVLGTAAMGGTVAAIRKLGSRPSWGQAASLLAPWPQQQAVARIAQPLLRFLRAGVKAFWQLLEDPQTPLKPITPANLTNLEWLEKIRGSKAQTDPFAEFIKRLQSSPTSVNAALIKLHRRVWNARNRDDCWVEEHQGRCHVRRDLKFRLPPIQATQDWDLRWSVCARLIRQTHWRPQ